LPRIVDADTGEIEVPHAEHHGGTGLHVSGSRIVRPGDEDYDYWLQQVRELETIEKFFTDPEHIIVNPQREKFMWKLEDIQRQQADDRDREK
jgi:hypothetical protein